jgi:hypothetical protein
MRTVSFVLALAAGIVAGNMSSENAAAQKQRELQSNAEADTRYIGRN